MGTVDCYFDVVDALSALGDVEIEGDSITVHLPTMVFEIEEES